MITPGFEKVGNCFEELLTKHNFHPAAQLSVYHQNKLVVNLAGNKPGSAITVDETTPFLLFSISKCFTAAAIFQLLDQKRIHLDDPIVKYWPEFGQGGKENATIRHALLHQAGIPAPHLNQQVLSWSSWERVTKNVAKEKALYPPGTETAYHLVNFGFILGEVVRRVTGLLISDYLQKEFFDPMGLKNIHMKSTPSQLESSPLVTTEVPGLRMTARVFNYPSIRRALIPAGGVRSSAQDLAAFFQMLLNDGEYQGKRYLSPESIRLATQSHYDGFDSYLKTNMNWGMGFIVGGGKTQTENPKERILGYKSSGATFSGFGMGTCMAWADRKTQTVTTFTCNGMLDTPEVDQRWAKISNSVWDCLN